MEWGGYDHCEECRIYGDDYLTNENGEPERYCVNCPFNTDQKEDMI